MSRVVFMRGPAGAGKSTVARQLEDEGMVRLSFDEVAWKLGLRTMPLDAETQKLIESALRDRMVALIKEDADVVLDFSFWSRSMRDTYRDLLRPLGGGAGDHLFGNASIQSPRACSCQNDGTRGRLPPRRGTGRRVLRSLRGTDTGRRAVDRHLRRLDNSTKRHCNWTWAGAH